MENERYNCYVKMHGIVSFTKIDSEQARSIRNCKNIKYKLLRTNAAIWYNEKCRKQSTNIKKEIFIEHFLHLFYIHGSVHRDSILIRSNKMQKHAGIYLLKIYSTCFGCPSHQSSGVHKTVTAASSTGHSI